LKDCGWKDDLVPSKKGSEEPPATLLKMTFFASSKNNDSECVSIVGSQEVTIDGGSPSDPFPEESSPSLRENQFRDEDENLTQASSSDKDTWASEHDDEDVYEGAKGTNKMNRRALIVEEPESSFESIDSSNWPRSWNGTSPSKAGDHNYRPRLCKVMVIVTLMIVLSTLLGVFVSNKNEATTSKTENLRASSVVTQSPPTNSSNIFDGEKLDEENMNNKTSSPTANATEPIDDMPTAAPTEGQENCTDMLRTDDRCYTRQDLRNDALTIGFVRCKPHRENWIGIYDAGLSAASLPEPLLWLWTCDKQDILDCNEMGVVSGALRVSGMLGSGFYQAHLVERNGNAPYSAFISSDVFQVSQDCAM